MSLRFNTVIECKKEGVQPRRKQKLVSQIFRKISFLLHYDFLYQKSIHFDRVSKKREDDVIFDHQWKDFRPMVRNFHSFVRKTLHDDEMIMFTSIFKY